MEEKKQREFSTQMEATATETETETMTTTTTTTTEKPVMVIGVDDSEYSFYALEWIIDHFFTNLPSDPPFKLLIVHVKPLVSCVVGLGGAGSAEVFPYVEQDLKKIAARVIEKAKEICIAKLANDVTLEVVEGDPRTVLCDAVEKYQASMLVVGNRGYGAIRRAVLGSVSDYCSHHARCTVMVVKKPKMK